MLEKLKNGVFKANLDLVNQGLVIHTWGNVSGRDKESGLIVIKPSGVSYKSMSQTIWLFLILMEKLLKGKYKPSTDAPTHLFCIKLLNQ